jgi:photosystem II stability/assembly factor-like uncharacterized protein
MTIDPTDESTIYVGTADKGLLYTHSSGDAWFYTLLGQGVVNAVAVDPADRCTLYAAVFNKIYKSTDCAREWKVVHLSSLEGEYFTAISVDPENSRIVYLGTQRGTLIRSLDSGFSWEAIKFFPSPLVKIIVNPKNSQALIVATNSSGIYQSTDGGSNWSNLMEKPVLNAAELEKTKLNPDQKPNDKPQQLKSLGGASNYFDLIQDPSDLNQLLYACNYGIFRLSADGIWREISILNKPTQEKVVAVALNPANSQELFFVTDGAYYQSADGGVNWTVKPLPTAGTPRFLIVKPSNVQEAYIGYYKAK